MKFLYVFPCYAEGGSSVHAREFLAASQRLGYDVAAVSIPVKEGQPGINVFLKILRFIINNLKCLKAFLTVYLRFKPDYVVLRFQPNHTLFLCILFARIFSKLVLEVNATRSIEPTGKSDPFERRLDELSFNLAQRLFAVSSVVRNRLLMSYEHLPIDKLTVIHNGCNPPKTIERTNVDTLKESVGLSHFEILVGYVGSFQAWHDVDTILEVAARSPANVGYIIVGDGPNRTACENKSNLLQLGNTVFLGKVPHEQVFEWIALCDITLLTIPRLWCEQPGGFHGSPLKLFDYMAMAKPVIATASGDVADIVEDGVNGFHIAPEDVDDLLKKVLYLGANKEFARQMGEKGQRKVAEKYTWEANAAQVAQLCLSIK